MMGMQVWQKEVHRWSEELVRQEMPNPESGTSLSHLFWTGRRVEKRAGWRHEKDSEQKTKIQAIN